MLDQIALIHTESALDALDHAGTKLREAIRKSLRESQRSKWIVKVVDGKRRWIRGDKPGEFGGRFNFKKAGPEGMANMVNSFLMPRAMTLVVAGMNKSASVAQYRDGKVVGALRVGQVLGGSYEILKKLNNGGSFDSQSMRYKGTRMGIDTKPIGKNPTYTARRFIERGRASAMADVQAIMTSQLEALIGRQINRVNIKTQVRASS